MNPDDDPEKRIRDLERPLADQAQTSELRASGPASGWPPPPPPVPPMPPAYYGPPMPPMPQPSVPSPQSGIRIGWIVLALLIVGLFVGGGAIAWTYMSTRSAPGFPSISGGDSTFPTGTRPSRATATPTPPTPIGPSSTPAPGGNVTVSGANADKTIACDDNTVTISGMANTVVITGHCKHVQVSGMNNIVTVDAADSIDASGMDNKEIGRAHV